MTDPITDEAVEAALDTIVPGDTALGPEYREMFRDMVASILTAAAPHIAALVAEVERLRSEVAGWEGAYPCDGHCDYNSGPSEDCSRHGRRPADLWEKIAALEKVCGAAAALVAAWEDAEDIKEIHAEGSTLADALDEWEATR